MQKQYLPSIEKNKISNHKQIYLILRAIHFWKICLATQKITKDFFEHQLSKFLEKYELIVSMVPDFSLQKFIQQFAIPSQQVVVAIKEIQLRQNKQKNQNTSNFLFMEVTSLFIEALDSDELNVAELRHRFEKIINRLNSLSNIFKNYEFNEKLDELRKIVQQYLVARNVSEEISERELCELKLIIKGLYDMMISLARK